MRSTALKSFGSRSNGLVGLSSQPGTPSPRKLDHSSFPLNAPHIRPWVLPPGGKNTHTAEALLGDHANPSQTPPHPHSSKEFCPVATGDTLPQLSKSRQATPSTPTTQISSAPLWGTQPPARAPTRMLMHHETSRPATLSHISSQNAPSIPTPALAISTTHPPSTKSSWTNEADATLSTSCITHRPSTPPTTPRTPMNQR